MHPGASLTLFVGILALGRVQCQGCQDYLNWAPRYRYRVFMAFFNHAHCASWTTRSSFNKQPTNVNSLKLPRGVPFAFWCGACFTPTRYTVNLTITLVPEAPIALQPLKNFKNKVQHKLNNDVCLLTYGLTGPLTRGGAFTCRYRVNGGFNYTKDETLYFGVRNSVIVEDDPVITVTTGKDDSAYLACPETDLKDKRNLVNVWHYLDEETPRVAKTTTSPNITFRPDKERVTIACSVYDMFSPNKVWRRVYRVEASRPEAIRTTGEPAPLAGAAFNMNTIIIGSVIGGVLCVATALACLSYRMCPCQQKHPHHPPPERITQSLLQQDKNSSTQSPNGLATAHNMEGEIVNNQFSNH